MEFVCKTEGSDGSLQGKSSSANNENTTLTIDDSTRADLIFSAIEKGVAVAVCPNAPVSAEIVDHIGKKSIPPIDMVHDEYWHTLGRKIDTKGSRMYWKHFGSVEFPHPIGININMMPFELGNPNSIPEEYYGYLSLIRACLIPEIERGKIYYLTIQESIVDEGHFQRRPGLHTDKHATFSWGNCVKGGGVDRANFDGPYMHRWGGYGGIYMASNVSESCAVWDANIEEPGLLGDCEDKREELGEPFLLKANELYWITDSTPHETLPMTQKTFRQFFRLVSSEVDLWYQQHSTPNPLGIQPRGKIVTENKFECFDDGLK